MIRVKNAGVKVDGYSNNFFNPFDIDERIAFNMDSLQGTEKQIAYAHSLIHQAIDASVKNIEQGVQLEKLTKENALEYILTFIEKVEKIESAKDVIEWGSKRGSKILAAAIYQGKVQ